MTSFGEFEKHYSRWLRECVAELQDMEFPKEVIENCEICEDGAVHFHRSSLYDLTLPGYVTPWEQSKYYVEG